MNLNINNIYNSEKQKNMIPNNIFQTHKSQNYINKNKLLQLFQKSWKKNKKFKYHFFSDNDIELFMRNNYNKNINSAFDLCPITVMKTDLWRYCVIYKYGGIYADMDTHLITGLHIFKKNALLTAVPENDVHMCNWVFAAPKKSPILKEIINLSVKRINSYDFKKNEKGEHYVHFLTGPGCFTDGFESWLKKEKLKTFRDKINYTKYKIPNKLHIYNYKIFHKKYVKHYFSGHWLDGWWLNNQINLLTTQYPNPIPLPEVEKVSSQKKEISDNEQEKQHLKTLDSQIKEI